MEDETPFRLTSEAAKELSRLGAAKGGEARARNLTPERRSDIARQAVMKRWAGEGKEQPIVAEYGAQDRPLRIGVVEIPCYVLPGGMRVLAQRGLQSGIGMSEGGGQRGARKIAEFMARLQLKGLNIRDLVARVNSPIRFIPPHGGNPADGYEATILPDICAVIIDADQKGKLDGRLKRLSERAALLQHGFSTAGIIALVDEATGYQDIRAKDALAKILEAFVAKELQAWVPTFSLDYYKGIYRLRGWKFPEIPKDQSKRPSIIGKMTNDLVYDRLAPGVRNELNKLIPRNDKGQLTQKLHQGLTREIGHPKLREHLDRIETLMDAAEDWKEFKRLVNRSLPRHTDTPYLPFNG